MKILKLTIFIIMILFSDSHSSESLQIRKESSIYTIKKGSIINLIFQKGGLLIESKAMALENGIIGSEIKFRTLDSKKIIKAKVIDHETASIL